MDTKRFKNVSEPPSNGCKTFRRTKVTDLLLFLHPRVFASFLGLVLARYLLATPLLFFLPILTFVVRFVVRHNRESEIKRQFTRIDETFLDIS